MDGIKVATRHNNTYTNGYGYNVVAVYKWNVRACDAMRDGHVSAVRGMQVRRATCEIISRLPAVIT